MKRKIKSFFDCRVELIKENQNKLFNQQQTNLDENVKKLENNLNTVNNSLNAISDEINNLKKVNQYVNQELLYLELNKLKSKRILLVGFYGADNLGDELMLQTVLSYFPKEKLSDITVLLCDNDQYDYSHLPAINILHYPKNKFDYNILAQEFDTLIWGGGALIDDRYYDESSTALNNMFIDLSLRFITFEKKVFALGLSSNQELTNSNYISKLKTVCEKSTAFTLRDIYSYEKLKALGITNISLLNDPVFYNDILKTLPKYRKNSSNCVRVGVIWICYPNTQAQFNILMSKLRNKFENNSNLEIVLIPFYNYVNLDKNYFKAMTQNSEYSDIISICDYTNDLTTLAETINGLDYIVNMRYHGMLISGMLNKKAFNIFYDCHPHYHNKIKYLNEIFEDYNTVLLSDFSQDTQLSFSEPSNKAEFDSQEFKNMVDLILKD